MYELEVVEEGRVVSRRRLVRAETVVGGGEACDVWLTSVPPSVQVVLRWTPRGIQVLGGGDYVRCGKRPVREGFLWGSERSLTIGRDTKLELRPLVSRTATHEDTQKISEDLQLRAGAAVIGLQTDRSTVIGCRHADLNVTHGSVAERHAKVEWRGGAYYIVDLGSGRETRVNGRVVPSGTAGARLRLGDQVACGMCSLDVELRGEVLDDGLVGESEAWRAVRAQIAAVADKPLVMIRGEPGTGKSLVAHALHVASGRSGDLVLANGAALVKDTSRSALFGHEKGAFSDAIRAREGVLEAAAGGTLVVSEGGAIDRMVQTQLLRVLEENEAMRVGGMKSVARTACFVFCVKTADMEAMRPDFRSRLEQFEIRLPPLRARGEDAILIAEHWLAALGRKVTLSASARKALRAYRWPGNVRELVNIIERSVTSLREGVEVLQAEALEWAPGAAAQKSEPPRKRGPYCEAFLAEGGSIRAGAKAMGTSRFLFEKGLKAEGFSAKELSDALKAKRVEALRQAVAEEGSFAAAGRKVGMTGAGVREAVGGSMEEISREGIEMRLQAAAGNVAVVAEDLGLSERTLRRRMARLGVFSGVARGPLGWLVIEGRRGAQRHPVHALGFSAGARGDNEVIVEDGPPQLAMVVQRGERLGLRVWGGAGVHAGGGLLLHARALDLDVGEVVRVGKTRLHLESDADLPAPAGRPPEQVVLRVGDRRYPIEPKGALTVGMDAEVCDVVVDDPFVSGRHLRIFEAGGRWHVLDLSSKNGTYVEGDLHREGVVRVPASLRIGDATLRLEWAKRRTWQTTYGFVGDSAPMKAVYKALESAKVARSVLVMGETGTGKELASRAMHDIWGGGPLVVVNCGGVSDELLHHELMGHVAGAFTGAREDMKGLIAQADGGTLFLDELGDMSARLQRQLMRVIADGAYTPMGVDQALKADVRVVAATNRDLAAMMEEGVFDRSLYDRFGKYIQLPPLRARGDGDVLMLAEYLLDGRGGWRLEPGAFELLRGREWSRNVRELRNVLQAATMLAMHAGDVGVGRDVMRRALREPGREEQTK